MTTTIPDVHLDGYAVKRGCPKCAVANDYLYDPSLQVAPSPAAQARMDAGVAFEAEIGDQLSEQVAADSLAVIAACDRSAASKAAREAATVDAMRAGVRVIWNARLPRADHRSGEPDMLVRIGDAPKADGRWAYAPVDVKHHRHHEGAGAARTWPASDLATPWREAAVDRDGEPGIPQRVDSLQLAHYVRMLRSVGHAQDSLDGEGPVWGGIIGRERVVLWRDLTAALYPSTDRVTGQSSTGASALSIYDTEFRLRLALAQIAARDGAPGVAATQFAVCLHEHGCSEGPWREVAHAERVAADHVTLVSGVSGKVAVALVAAGITTRTQLAALDRALVGAVNDKVNVDALIDAARGVPAGTPVRAVAELALPRRASVDKAVRVLTGHGITRAGEVANWADMPQVRIRPDLVDAARVAVDGTVRRARGVDQVRAPRADVEVHVDMENDDYIYLWGALTGQVYLPFATFDATADAERDTFVAFWGWLRQTQKAAVESGRTFAAYCYTAAENRCLTYLADTYAGQPGVPSREEVDEFLASPAWVDLYQVVKAATVWPVESYSLKSLCRHLGYAWRTPGANGEESVTWYRDACANPDQDVRDAQQRKLLQYNEDDVRATAALLEFLTTSWFPPVEDLDGVAVAA